MTLEEARTPDFSIEGEGLWSVYLLRPLTPAAFRWIKKHIPDAQRLDDAIAIEHRYIDAIAEGILADGLVLEGFSSEPEQAI